MIDLIVIFRRSVAAALIGALASGLSACGPAPATSGIYDPSEVQNRRTHETNRNLDRALVRPGSNAYGESLPEPIRIGVSNFAGNLSEPSNFLNSVLQLRPGQALTATGRFVINSTIGLVGLFDPASSMGLERDATDFGETLHVWGVKEGAYIELPLAGPSTERDALGKVVDMMINPMNFLIPEPERYIATGAGLASKFGDRYRYSDFIDSVLYESEDSYAQARLLYLQNRRFKLLGVAEEPTYIDPYEETYE